MTRFAMMTLAAALTLTGCMTSMDAQQAAAVTDGEKTMIVASPLPSTEFVAGQEVQFEIEIYDGDKLGNAHPAPGGHYHVKLNNDETVAFESDIPSFRYTLPNNMRGSQSFRVEYHDGDGVSGRFAVTIPFTVRATPVGL